MFGISPFQMLVVGIVAVLLFGNRLPGVARAMGKSFIEFKKGMRGIEDDINDAVYNEDQKSVPHFDDEQEQEAPRFQPPTQTS